MLAELAEADAPPEIASIYAEMRHTTGAPMVALIWRHLATMPGVLAEVWRGLGPLYRSGRLQDAAWRAAAVNVQAAPADVGRARLIAAGLNDAGIAAFERVLEAYNRVNPVIWSFFHTNHDGTTAAPASTHMASERLSPS